MPSWRLAAEAVRRPDCHWRMRAGASGGTGFAGRPKRAPAGFGGGDALGLSLVDEFAFRLRDVAEQLKHDVRDQRAGEVFATSGIQKGHIQHDHVSLFFFCEDAPLLDDFVVVASQPVDAFDDEGVAPFQPFQKPLILRALEVPAGLLIQKNAGLANAKGFQGDELGAFRSDPLRKRARSRR